MGNQIVVSKHVSDFDDLIRIKNPPDEKLKLKINLDEEPKKHISIWRIDSIRSGEVILPLLVQDLLVDKSFTFDSKSCYIILLIEKKIDVKKKSNLLKSLGTFAWVLNSLENLTPRGLELPFASLDSSEFKSKVFFLNGKHTTESQKTFTLTKCLQLEDWIQRSHSFATNFLYYGYFTRNNKIKSGNRIGLIANEIDSATPNINNSALLFITKVLATEGDFRIAEISKKNSLKNIKHISIETRLDESLKKGSSKSTCKIITPKVAKEKGKFTPISPIPQSEFKRASNFPLCNAISSEKRVDTRFNLNLKNLNFNLFSDGDNESFMRETSRKINKLEEFEEICSEVVENKLYLSGYKVAKNVSLLKEKGITHILNCAGDYCPNLHTDAFQYRTYFIKDSKMENIECIFYDAIEFIDRAFESNGRVLVHCVQGVSRSVTAVIAYFIFRLRMCYQTSFDLVKKIRGIASPNIGFLAQLITFQMRIENKLPKESFPKIFMIGSHQVEDPRTIVARYVN